MRPKTVDGLLRDTSRFDVSSHNLEKSRQTGLHSSSHNLYAITRKAHAWSLSIASTPMPAGVLGTAFLARVAELLEKFAAFKQASG